MKIKKFNEESDYDISFKRYIKPINNSEKIKTFIKNFTDNAGDITDWINQVAVTTNT